MIDWWQAPQIYLSLLQFLYKGDIGGNIKIVK